MIWLNERSLRVDVLPGEDEKNGEDDDFDVAKGKRQRRSATCPFSNTALAVVGQRRSRLNSVRHADGSPTATCILYAVRVRRTVSLKSMDVDLEERSANISTPKGRPQESMVLNQGILASPTVLVQVRSSELNSRLDTLTVCFLSDVCRTTLPSSPSKNQYNSTYHLLQHPCHLDLRYHQPSNRPNNPAQNLRGRESESRHPRCRTHPLPSSAGRTPRARS
jgi:hypothetical protein